MLHTRLIPLLLLLTAGLHANPAQETLWSLRPVEKHALPQVRDTSWPQTPVDHFILEELEQEGWEPTHPADRATLIRRVTFDLIGLPPEPSDVDAFINDNAPGAFARVVDRLLGSPAYGERWGRHWLDTARYSDTKGYVFNEHTHLPYAFTYRNYVIDAFNRDLPYDRFILEQLAADQLEDVDRSAFAGMGFLTVGGRFKGNPYEVIDDRIDVVSRGLLALTVNCARCHDHKYDPIPTADYYSLYGVFASSVEPEAHELPIIADVPKTGGYHAYFTELKKRSDQYYSFLREKRDDFVDQIRSRVGDYLLEVLDLEEEPPAGIYLSFGAGEIRPQIVRRWYLFLEETRKNGHPVFAPWHALREIPEDGEFHDKAKALLESMKERPPEEANALIVAGLLERAPRNMPEVARAYGQVFLEQYEYHRERAANPFGDGQDFGALEASRTDILAVLLKPDTPTFVEIKDTEELIDRPFMDRVGGMKSMLQALAVDYWEGPPRGQILVDADELIAPRVFIRGDPRQRGERVPRQWLGMLSNGESRIFQHGSGRLELARRIASRDNPLTARVLVNRLWMHHFGKGIVRTPDDFGTRSDPPTHPKLLDYLAHRLMANEWSIKRMHREILLSATYRQASTLDETKDTRDPDNRLVGRMNRKRLDWESLRDALLAAGGHIDQRSGGRSVDIMGQPFSRRRSVYAFVDRLNIPSVLRMFDIANPDTTTPKRHETVVPQQALYLMNSPFLIEQAREVARRPEIAGSASPEDRVRAMYHALFARVPDEIELAAGALYLKAKPTEKSTDLSATEKLAQVLLLTNEFVYVE